MKKTYSYTLIAIIAIGITAFTFSTNSEVENISTQIIENVHPNENEHYYEADIGKAFPDYEIVHNAVARDLNFEKAKKDIKSTVKGTVIDIGEIKTWNDKTMNPELIPIVGERIKIDVQIEVEKSNNNVYKKGEIVTVTLLGAILPDSNIVALDDDEEFELGEEVIIHVAEDPNDIVDENVHYVKLGKYGKYTIQDGKAYNDSNHYGKSIEQALNEAN